ncbi:hypothetical protein PGTUg99_008479 [Puccinia graminis f. sp. tritici]|uniref:Uncharacterized protein n=1 Tax=Puccinia graminis f. sp. tritici TaxID=56615 RepID=A0A5B0M2P1_PUCGR|nr:hypothetical protein PGTUg99_008479 [Puccinia graminis f. sp. tritici]
MLYTCAYYRIISATVCSFVACPYLSPTNLPRTLLTNSGYSGCMYNIYYHVKCFTYRAALHRVLLCPIQHAVLCSRPNVHPNESGSYINTGCDKRIRRRRNYLPGISLPDPLYALPLSEPTQASCPAGSLPHCGSALRVVRVPHQRSPAHINAATTQDRGKLSSWACLRLMCNSMSEIMLPKWCIEGGKDCWWVEKCCTPCINSDGVYGPTLPRLKRQRKI